MAEFRIGIYVRVSTDEQAREGFSIDAQRRILDAWTVIKGATSVTAYIDEGYSAKNMRRPAMQRLLADCRARKLDAVLVWRLDRLSRSLRDLVVTVDDILIPNNIQLISATESIDTSTPSGRLMLNILGSFAQNERENTSQRVRMVMNDMAREGNRHMGGVALYGYQIINHKYEIEPREADAVRMIFTLKASGFGYGEIVKRLSAAGHLTRSGEPFKKNTIYDMIRNPRYKGLYIYNRIENYHSNGSRSNRASKPASEIISIDGGNPAIVSEELWQSVNSSMDNNRTSGGQASAKRIYLLSGIIWCGACHQKMVVKNIGRDRRGGYYISYRCPVCKRQIHTAEADSALVRYVADLASQPDLVNAAIRIAQSTLFENADSVRDDLRMLSDQRDALQKRQRNIMDYVAAIGADADPSFAAEARKISASLKTLSGQIERITRSMHAFSADRIRAAVDELSGIAKLDPLTQRIHIRRLIHSAVVYPDRIDIYLKCSASIPPPVSPPDDPHDSPPDPASFQSASGIGSAESTAPSPSASASGSLGSAAPSQCASASASSASCTVLPHESPMSHHRQYWTPVHFSINMQVRI